MTLAEKQHRFICRAIKAGRVVLVYKAHGKPHIVKRAELIDGKLFVDNIPTHGMTIALKP